MWGEPHRRLTWPQISRQAPQHRQQWWQPAPMTTGFWRLNNDRNLFPQRSSLLISDIFLVMLLGMNSISQSLVVWLSLDITMVSIVRVLSPKGLRRKKASLFVWKAIKKEDNSCWIVIVYKWLDPKEMFQLHNCQTLSPKQKVWSPGVGVHPCFPLQFFLSSLTKATVARQNSIKTLRPAPKWREGCTRRRPADPAASSVHVHLTRGLAPYPREKHTPWCPTLVSSSEQWHPGMTAGQLGKGKKKIFPSIQKKMAHTGYKLTAICDCWLSLYPSWTAPGYGEDSHGQALIWKGGWNSLFWVLSQHLCVQCHFPLAGLGPNPGNSWLCPVQCVFPNLVSTL